jgi:hypothetical protein
LSTLNWKVIRILAWIEAVILAVLWYAMPPTNPALTISAFASSFLLGMGLALALRVKGLRKQVLLLAPFLAVTMLSALIVPHFAENLTGSYGLDEAASPRNGEGPESVLRCGEARPSEGSR